jgi:hypothetical protein
MNIYFFYSGCLYSTDRLGKACVYFINLDGKSTRRRQSRNLELAANHQREYGVVRKAVIVLLARERPGGI